MDNLVLLSKQFLKPVKISLIVVDSIWVLYIAFLVMMEGLDSLLSEGLFLIGLLVVLLIINLFLFEAKKPEKFFEKWPPDALKSINEECMTGYRCGNGILCENGCLLIVGMKIKAFLPQNIKMIHKLDTQGGLIFVTDRWNEQQQNVVRASSRAVQGKGTFREVNIETFWEILSSVHERAGVENNQRL